jgi:DNA polymerase-3 subunit delta
VPPVTPSTLRTQVASGQTASLYMLVGADEVEKSAVAGEFAGMVEEDLRAFNVERLYGGETRVDALADAARTLPMMAPRRVIIVMESEKLFIPKRESKAADEELDRLAAFIGSPPAHATIVFVFGATDDRRRLIKLLREKAQVVDCGSVENAADAERWVRARAARDNIRLEPAAVRALVERAGNDVVRLRGGLERVALYAMGASAITSEDVHEAVAAGPGEQANFGIANAIGRGDVREALKELGLALEAGSAPFFVLGQIRAAAERLPAQQLEAGIEAVFRTDLALKSSGGDQRILLERLVVELAGSVSRAPRGAYRR